nr:hypothetical protein [Tanacetum cinerariifolium]
GQRTQLLIAELNVFSGPLALYCVEFSTQLSQIEVLKMLEIRKSIAEVNMQIRMIPVGLYLLLYYIHGDDEVGTWVAIFVVLFRQGSWSVTLGSTEEADNVKILQSCNGLLLCGGSRMPVFDYVYNLSTNQYKKLLYPDYSIDNSPYYGSVGLRIAFDPTKSPHYKLVDAGRESYDIDIQIYSSKIGKWSLCMDHFNYFSFDHFDSSNVWSIVLGEKEQDSFLVIKFFGRIRCQVVTAARPKMQFLTGGGLFLGTTRVVQVDLF